MTFETLEQFWPSFVGATIVVLVHLAAPRFRFMQNPYDVWLPASAGVAVAYVFMDIFPHLARTQGILSEVADGSLYGFMAHNVYFVALAGFVVYLGAALRAIMYRKTAQPSEITFASAPTTVRLEILSIVVYNAIIGYLLAEQVTHRPTPVIIFASAMAIHFVGIDSLLREHYKLLFDQVARFAFAAAVYAGWLIGFFGEISDSALAILFSFLAGGIIVLATVYEIPEIRSERQYRPFLVGAGIFSALMLAKDFF